VNPLGRVKALLARMGKQLALTILPLAAAVPAQVSSINIGPYSVCDPTATAAVAAAGSGIQFTSTAANCSGGTYFSASGTPTGMSAGSTFPVSWDFDVSESDAGVAFGTVTLNYLDLDVSVPEAAALFLAAPGLGLLLLKHRKRAPRGSSCSPRPVRPLRLAPLAILFVSGIVWAQHQDKLQTEFTQVVEQKFDARPALARIATEDERTLANQGHVTLRAIVSAAGIADIPPISRQQTRFTKEPS
jgi:hypothetical protein